MVSFFLRKLDERQHAQEHVVAIDEMVAERPCDVDNDRQEHCIVQHDVDEPEQFSERIVLGEQIRELHQT